MAAYIGIDPGANGALACVNDAGEVTDVLRLAKYTPREWFSVLSFFRRGYQPPHHCFIERVSAMPRQGVSSTFKFGYNAGMLEAFVVAAGIPYEFVAPATWQRGMKCLSRGDKNVTKKAAGALFPSEYITHATADALLIAEYCRRVRSEQRRSDDD